MIRSALLSTLAATTLLVLFGGAAGDAEPSLIRTAVMEGVRGPVYYSVTEGRYLPIVVPDGRLASSEPVDASH